MIEYNNLYYSARRLENDTEIMKACLRKTKCYLEMSRQFCDCPGISLLNVDKERYHLEKAIQDFERYNYFINTYIDFLQTFGSNVKKFEEEVMRMVAEIPNL